ncbi:MAG: hypothetical protein PVH35_01305 [Syntrophobacterales bacterium]
MAVLAAVLAVAVFALVAVSELSEARFAELFTPAHVFTILTGLGWQREKVHSNRKPERTDYEDSVAASSGNARTIENITSRRSITVYREVRAFWHGTFHRVRYLLDVRSGQGLGHVMAPRFCTGHNDHCR